MRHLQYGQWDADALELSGFCFDSIHENQFGGDHDWFSGNFELLAIEFHLTSLREAQVLQPSTKRSRRRYHGGSFQEELGTEAAAHYKHGGSNRA